MKTLSIKQPWAELIARGMKTIELRSWKTDYRGDILIQTSSKPHNMKITKMKDESGRTFLKSERQELNGFYYLGYAYFIVELYKIEKFNINHQLNALHQFKPGLYAWHLRNVRPVNPFKLKGKLLLFETVMKVITN